MVTAKSMSDNAVDSSLTLEQEHQLHCLKDGKLTKLVERGFSNQGIQRR